VHLQQPAEFQYGKFRKWGQMAKGQGHNQTKRLFYTAY